MSRERERTPRLRRVADLAGRAEYLLLELRRRRVFRVLAGYIALSFALLQLADLVYPVLGLPEWAFSGTVALSALGLVPTLALAWIYDLTSEGLRRTPAAEPARPAEGPPSLAVLPFANLTPDAETEYFSDGVTEDIIARVGGIAGLRVISRTSVMQYKGVKADAPAIAQALRVTHILEGSVRRAGGRVRIVAQLIDAQADEHCWVETYDSELEDIFEIQSSVANRIAQALEARLTPGARARLDQRPTADMAAYDLYLRGRHAWGRRSADALQESVRLLEAATARDPGFAVAWAALAEAHITLAIYGAVAPAQAMHAARTAADHALGRDRDLAEALNARACIAALADFDFATAARDFTAAIRGNPQYATAHQWQAMHLLAPLARFDEARASLARAQDIDPLSAAIRVSAGVLAYYARDYEGALAYCADTLRAAPDFGFAWYVTGVARLAQGDAGGALAGLQRALELSPGSAEFAAGVALAEAAGGDRAAAANRLAALEERARSGWVSPVVLAQVDVALDERTRAIERLEQARLLRAPDLIWSGVRPTLDPLRGEAAMVTLLERLGLPNGVHAPPSGHGPRRPVPA